MCDVPPPPHSVWVASVHNLLWFLYGLQSSESQGQSSAFPYNGQAECLQVVKGRVYIIGISGTSGELP